ncbi:hypothetical protein [Thomasclavelia sp.]|uniref:hypothetical protein n=1 Tax=Thomasclavelia sp. TaxID=3025757 RepID=UPI0025FC4B38|nr:hypothetical protein [Thomasclavelia sp.]
MKDTLKNDFPLDDVGGMLTEPLGDYTLYNFREIIKYCNERKIEPKNLSEAELKQFKLTD